MKFPEILVVDDEVYTTEIIMKRLRSEGLFRITAVHNGRDAVKKASELLPDLILLDIMLPDLSGYEVLKILKDNKTTKEIPVIFLTVKEMIADKVEGLKIGASDYITKPFSPEELTARVKAVLRTRFLYKELIEKALLEERDFISSELHDGIGSYISSISLLTSLARKKLESEPGKVKEMLEELSRKTSETMDQLKNTVYVLRYEASKSLGDKLDEFLCDAFYLKDIEYSFQRKGDRELEPALELAIFRIFQEGASNIMKHSNAQNVRFYLNYNDDGVEFKISDDGSGFKMEEKKGFGLKNMRKRVERFSGTIDFKVDRGTEISLFIPYSKEDIKSSLLS